jgi:hypothetical protein
VFFFISAPTIPEKKTGIVSDVGIGAEALTAVSVAAASVVAKAFATEAVAAEDVTAEDVAAESVAGDLGGKKLKANTVSLAIRSPFFIAETSALASPERTFWRWST